MVIYQLHLHLQHPVDIFASIRLEALKYIHSGNDTQEEMMRARKKIRITAFGDNFEES